MWANQITDLSADHRVIAYDHRGHGLSGVPPRRGNYSLDFLAADLDAVLGATLAPGERAVIAGHSMGGIAITSWSQRYPHRVRQNADAVALINTTTGDLLRNVKFLPVPRALVGSRVLAAGSLLKTFGAAPLVPGSVQQSRRFVSQLAVGRDADPAIADFVFDLFADTPPAGRGGWARVLVDSLGPKHISLQNLTVPTLVIGSRYDRLLPIGASRRIAAEAPNLASFVEMAGGHCAILERPDEVNQHLRTLVESVRQQAADQLVGLRWAVTSSAARRPDRTAPSRNPVHWSAVSGSCPEDAVHRSSQPLPVGRPRPGGHRRRRAAGRELLGAPAVIDVVDGVQRVLAEQGGEALEGAGAPVLRCQRVEGPRVGEPEQDAGARPEPVSSGLTSKVMNTGPSSDSASPEWPSVAPERRLVGGVGLAQVALRPVSGEVGVAVGQSRLERDGGAVRGWDRDDDGSRGVPRRRPCARPRRERRARCAAPRSPSRTRSPSSSAIRSAICWVPAGKRSCWAPPSTSSMGPMPPAALT